MRAPGPRKGPPLSNNNMSTTNFKTDARSKRLLLVNKFRELAEVNQYKRDTKIARIAEFSFIQGALCADPKMADDPVIAICLMSGRSILSLSTEEDPDTWLDGDWACELGWCLAAEASGSGAAWTDDGLPEHGLPLPPCPATDDSHYVEEKAGATV